MKGKGNVLEKLVKNVKIKIRVTAKIHPNLYKYPPRPKHQSIECICVQLRPKRSRELIIKEVGKDLIHSTSARIIKLWLQI